MRRYIAVCMTGASGLIYGIRLVDQLLARTDRELAVVYSRGARRVAELELGKDLAILLRELVKGREDRVAIYDENDWLSPLASSSTVPEAVVVAPCSLRTLSDIARGSPRNVIVRAAHSAIRLRRPLVLVVRETPLTAADIENMLRVSLMGAVVLPASPAFYYGPKSIDDIVYFVVGKVLDVLGLEHDLYPKWASRSRESSSSNFMP
ncbi:MAG: UbiX family flavin prenyltransferase [Fervidicoccaceae archaeon]